MTDPLGIPQTLLIGGIGWLDALPDGIRAMLAALLLAGLLAFFERRIPRQETHYGQSFRKTALVALLLVPAFVALVPASRMIVFVETLPAHSDVLSAVWTTVELIWLAGVLVTGTCLIRHRRGRRREAGSLPVLSDERLNTRLRHWQARLGLSGPAALTEAPGDQPRFLDAGRRLLFPSAARHWSLSQQDMIMINGLCSLKLRHFRWHWFAQLVSCVYWPVTWVQRLHANLLQDFQQAACNLAGSCYQDRLGYDRALRQLEQRLAPPRRGRKENGHSTGRLLRSVTGYPSKLIALLRPTDPGWALAGLVASRSEGTAPAWTDPYDRVVLFVGQAVFVAFLLTGVTLREQPPEVDDRYVMPFGLLWKEHFHRNLELKERTQP